MKQFTSFKLHINNLIVNDIIISKVNTTTIPNPTFDDIFISELRSKKLHTEVVTSSQIFLPTRTYSKEDMSDIIAKNKFDTILYIVVNGENSNSQVVSYLTNSSA